MQKHARILFVVAALFNFAVGLSLLFAWPLTQDLLQLAPAQGSNKLLINIAAVLIITFGYAYFMASRNPVAYRAYIHLGTVGKLLVAAVAIPVLVNRSQGYLIAWLAMGDFVFALLFMNFMRIFPAPNQA